MYADSILKMLKDIRKTVRASSKLQSGPNAFAQFLEEVGMSCFICGMYSGARRRPLRVRFINRVPIRVIVSCLFRHLSWTNGSGRFGEHWVVLSVLFHCQETN